LSNTFSPATIARAMDKERTRDRFQNLLAKRDEIKTHSHSLHDQLHRTERLLEQALALARDLLEAQDRHILHLDRRLAEAERREQLPRCPHCGQRLP
jgi:predicted RNase H-like nuclease (RuvC/YqgF family)